MEEFSGGFEQINNTESAEKSNAINEAAIERVIENTKRAQQTAQASKQDRKKNQKFAEFLTFLLQTIQDNALIASVYHVFFKTKHPRTKTTFIRKNVNIIVICGIFAPFHYPQLQKFKLDNIFGKIYDFNSPITLQKYLSYLKKLSQTYHDNIPIEKAEFLNFLINIIIYYKLDNLALHNTEERAKVLGLLEKELFM